MTNSSRVIYTISTWVFLFGVTIQVFLAGLIVVASRSDWAKHAAFGQWLGLPILLMLITAYLGHLPVSMKYLTWALAGVYVIQVALIAIVRQAAPTLAAVHPVLALVDFILGFLLARRPASVDT